MNLDELELYNKLTLKEIPDHFGILKPVVIHGMEVTQAIQYYRSSQHLTDPADRAPDNSVRIAAHKPAWVRVYLRRQVFVTEVPGVTGTLDVYRRHMGVLYQLDATLTPESPGTVTARHNPTYDAERSTLSYSLNFIIPSDLMCGHLKLTAHITTPSGDTDDYDVYIDATLEQTLNVRGIMVGYDGPESLAPGAANLTLAAPTLADLQTTSGWTLLIYPVQSEATYGDAGSITWDRPLTDSPSCSGCCTPNWVALNAAIQAQKVADGNRTDVLYYGIMAEGIPMGPVIGCNSGGVSSGENNNQTTMAHELGHACGLPHAPCGVGGDPNFPVYEPYDTGGTAHAFIGEYGLDISNGTIKPPASFKDWMSYCGPRWISLYNCDRLTDNSHLDPHLVCEDHPWFHEEYELERIPWPPEPFPILRRRYIYSNPEPVISVIGIVHREDFIEIKSVMRLETIPQVPKSFDSELTAEIMGKEGKVIVSAPVLRLPSWGDGCCSSGCDSGNTGNNTPYIFQVFLSETESGDAIRIRRGEKEVWSRQAPKNKPRIGSFGAEIVKNGELAVFYNVEGAGKEQEYWLQWSGDRGKSWHALSTRGGREGTRLSNPGLPSGQVLIRLLTGNGFHTTVSDPVKVDVPERPPVIAILTPRQQQALIEGQSMRLWGVVSNPTGKAEKPERAVWLIDGKEVATGLDAFIAAPRRGKHKLTLVVRKRNKKTEKTVSFTTLQAPKE
jgi:hypothetical protein